MEKNTHKDITELIAEKLREHQVPYREGAWEDFQKKEKTGKKPLWYWLSAAAALLILGSLFLFNREPVGDIQHTDVLVQQKQIKSEAPSIDLDRPSNAYMPSTSQTASPIMDTEVEVALESSIKQPKRDWDQQAGMHGILQPSEANTFSVHAAQIYMSQAHLPVVAQVDFMQEPTTSIPTQQAMDAGSMALLSSAKTLDPSLPAQKAGSAWGFAVHVAPIMSADDINMGGGLEVSYQLSKKIALKTGVSYMELDAHKNIGRNQLALMDAPSSGAKALFFPSKTLNSINTRVSGIDIPVHMEYKITNRFFASAGVSVFNVIKENRVHNYRTQIQELSASTTGSASNRRMAAAAPSVSASAPPKPVIKTVYSSEKVTQAPYERSAFTGFVDLSVGYQLPVLGNLHLSVEPFYKIPVKARSMQDMDLTSGGLRISAGF